MVSPDGIRVLDKTEDGMAVHIVAIGQSIFEKDSFKSLNMGVGSLRGYQASIENKPAAIVKGGNQPPLLLGCRGKQMLGGIMLDKLPGIAGQHLAVMYLFLSLPWYVKIMLFRPVNYGGRISGVIILTFLSYPILFTVDRGNLGILVFLFLLLFVNYYQKGDDVKSVIFLSLAIAMKLYPGVFVVLFCADKKYKNIIYTGVLVLALSILSAAVLEGGIQTSLQGLQHNLGLFKEFYMHSVMGLHFNTSLYGAITILGEKFTFLSIVLKYYTVIALIAFVLVSLFIVLNENEFWKRVSLLVFMMLLLPQVTFDYKMIHLYIALMLFLNSHNQSKHEILYAILFGLLLIPKDYLIIQADISIAVFLNPLLMLMIAVTILLDRTSRRG